jgi:toxin-antitoxin system PIN domain toxin
VIAPDVNVLLYALREDTDRHAEYRRWLQEALNGEEPVALLEPVLAAVLRIATHPSIFRPPTPRAIVETFTDACLAAPAALALRPESRHWSIFRDLCRRADCRGNLVQDAYLAALAIEHQCVFVTTDRDFARFPRLQWRHPLDDDRRTVDPD